VVLSDSDDDFQAGGDEAASEEEEASESEFEVVRLYKLFDSAWFQPLNL
jgi:hypothetical protein